MADIYEVANPPHRVPIPIVKAGDRIGKTYIPVDPAKIVAIVPCDLPDVTRALAPLDDDAERMGNNLVDFLKNEVNMEDFRKPASSPVRRRQCGKRGNQWPRSFRFQEPVCVYGSYSGWYV